MKEIRVLIEEMERLADKWDISAVISLQNKQETIYERAYGWANREEKRPMTAKDRFCLSADSYFFLSLCLLHLYQQGRLLLNDRIGKFIPEYPLGKDISIMHLLRAESGIPDDLYQVRIPAMQKAEGYESLSPEEKFRREYMEKCRDISFSEVLRLIGDREIEHLPGSKEDGSFTAILFLAEIIRRISGKTAVDYLMEHIFLPLNMQDTRPGNDETAAHRGCMGDDCLVLLPRAEGAHCFTTTAEDMGILCRAILEERLFPKKIFQLALKCKRDYCGLGFCKIGDLYYADGFPERAGDRLQMYFQFDQGMGWFYLKGDELISRRENNDWRSFGREVRTFWQYQRAYPQKPEIKKVTGKNVWEAMEIKLKEEQLSFVPDVKACLADALARRQPVYLLKDQGLPVGIAALNIRPRQKEFQITYLQVDHRLQGRGYGRILLLKAMDILKEAGAKKLEIGVNRFNIPARRLYKSVGFQVDGLYEGFIEMKMELQ